MKLPEDFEALEKRVRVLEGARARGAQYAGESRVAIENLERDLNRLDRRCDGLSTRFNEHVRDGRPKPDPEETWRWQAYRAKGYIPSRQVADEWRQKQPLSIHYEDGCGRYCVVRATGRGWEQVSEHAHAPLDEGGGYGLSPVPVDGTWDGRWKWGRL